MEQCTKHVEYQLTNYHIRVEYLLKMIEKNNPILQAAMDSVRTDKGPVGMQNDFEACVAHILPYCPVSKKRTTGTKWGAVEISEVNIADEEFEITSFGLKYRKVPKTGVHLQYQKGTEYHIFSDKDKNQLREGYNNQNLYENNPKSNKGKLGYK